MNIFDIFDTEPKLSTSYINHDTNEVYIDYEYVKHKLWKTSFGLSKIKNFEMIKLYLNSSKFDNITIKFTKKHIKNVSFNDLWYGLPFKINILCNENYKYIPIGAYFKQYALDILLDAYSTIDVFMSKSDIDNISVNVTYTNVKLINNNIQITCYIETKDIKYHEQLAIKCYINLYNLSDKITMSPRIGDIRIGYFYDKTIKKITKIGTEYDEFIINRKNIKNMPWTYNICMPKKYTQYFDAIRKGILSWNNIFEKLNLGSPLSVNIVDENKNIFDMNGWYITNTRINKLNGPFSGISTFVTDPRNGENMYGIITLNMEKIITQPMRLLYLQIPNITNESDIAIEQHITWVTAHEVGHQLGLRHNFLGNISDNNFGSIMDYMDLFVDIDDLTGTDLSVDRQYDIIAIKYGYIDIPDGIDEHMFLNKIVDELKVPFGTDENYREDINPYINKNENLNEPIKYFNKIIDKYSSFRKFLLKQRMSENISAHDYNFLFLHIYTHRYPELINACLKFIGGRYFDKDRSQFTNISSDILHDIISLLHKLLSEIKYTDMEYKYIIYDAKHIVTNGSETNPIKNYSVYSLASNDLYFYYKNMVKIILNGCIDIKHLTRLDNPIQFLSKFTFDNNAIFTYTITKNIIYDKYKMDIQFMWIKILIKLMKTYMEMYNIKENYEIVMSVYSILKHIYKNIEIQKQISESESPMMTTYIKSHIEILSHLLQPIFKNQINSK